MNTIKDLQRHFNALYGTRDLLCGLSFEARILELFRSFASIQRAIRKGKPSMEEMLARFTRHFMSCVNYFGDHLFNAAERLANALLAFELRNLGHTVISPQERVEAFLRKDGSVDLDSMADDCREQCRNRETVFVGNIDGPDTDSGTAVEFGTAKENGLTTILYRTDFRTSPKHEAGVNAMFRSADRILCVHCKDTDFIGVETFYQRLARMIARAIQETDFSEGI